MTIQHPIVHPPQITHPAEINHKRLTRNLHELLQELRVTQTGVQILTGFLLTLPFSSRFAELTSVQRHVYLAILCGSVIATGLIVAPVAFHRMLFQRGQRPWIVKNANRAARAGLVCLALTTSGVVWLVFDLVRPVDRRGRRLPVAALLRDVVGRGAAGRTSQRTGEPLARPLAAPTSWSASRPTRA